MTVELVGRESELAVLAEAVKALAAGVGSVVEVTGRGGTGRSSVVRWVAKAARRAGVLVLSATGAHRAGDRDGGVVAELMAQAELRHEPGTAGARLMELARTRPVLLTVDDADLLDRCSREWLAVLGNRAAPVPLMIVVTTGGSRPVLDGAAVLVLRSLDRAAITELVARGCGQPADVEFAAAVEHCTDGVPSLVRLVLDKFARTGIGPGVDGIESLAGLSAEARAELASQTVSALPAEVARLLRVIAVCGPDLDLDLICALAGLHEFARDRALEVLADRGLITGCDHPVLAGGLTVDGVLAGVSPAARQDLCARAARQGYRGAVAEPVVARMLAMTSPLAEPWVVPLLRTAARRESEHGRTRDAVRHLARALREPLDRATRAEVVFQLAMAETSHAPETADRRLARMLLEPQPSACARVRMAMADGLSARGDSALVRRTFNVAPATGAERAGLAMLYWRAEGARHEAPELGLLQLPEVAGHVDSPERAGGAAWLCVTRGDDVSRVRSLARWALAAPACVRMSRILACSALSCTDDVAEALAGLDRVITESRRLGLSAVVSHALLARASVRSRTGELDEAAADVDRAVAELPLANWHPDLQPLLIAVDMLVHLDQGLVTRAEQASARFPEIDLGHGYARSLLLFARGMLALARGEAEAGVEQLDECGRWLLARHWMNPAVLPWRTAMAAAVKTLGDDDRAARLCAEELALAESWGVPSPLGHAHLSMAQVVGGDAARAHLGEAVRLLRNSPRRLLHAQALLDFGQTTEPRSAAAPLIREAAEIAVSCRSRSLIERARALGWVPGA